MSQADPFTSADHIVEQCVEIVDGEPPSILLEQHLCALMLLFKHHLLTASELDFPVQAAQIRSWWSRVGAVHNSRRTHPAFIREWLMEYIAIRQQFPVYAFLWEGPAKRSPRRIRSSEELHVYVQKKASPRLFVDAASTKPSVTRREAPRTPPKQLTNVDIRILTELLLVSTLGRPLDVSDMKSNVCGNEQRLANFRKVESKIGREFIVRDDLFASWREAGRYIILLNGSMVRQLCDELKIDYSTI